MPLPKGDVHKKKEVIQDVTLHDLDVANARPQVRWQNECSNCPSDCSSLNCRFDIFPNYKCTIYCYRNVFCWANFFKHLILISVRT